MKLEIIEIDGKTEFIKSNNFCENIWRWRNNPDSRLYSLNKTYIQFEEHKKWFKKKIESKNTIVYECLLGGISRGIVRFENKKSNLEVSITLDPEIRGQGLSRSFLYKALDNVRQARKKINIIAKIHDKNIKSKSIFEDYGFKYSSREGEFGIYIMNEELNERNDLIKLKAEINENANSSIGIMQPTFLPWLGYFSLMQQVDIFILLDNVQLSKQSWQVRNRIRNKKGDKIWLTLPIQKTNLSKKINETLLSEDPRYKTKIVNTFQHNYSKTEYFDEAFDLLNKSVNSDSKKLSELTCGFIKDVKNMIGITTPIMTSSEINLINENRESRLIDLIQYFNCNEYLSPVGSRDYLSEKDSKDLFEKNNISIKYLNFYHPTYKQTSKEFIEQMSILDCISNVGLLNTLNLINQGYRKPTS